MNHTSASSTYRCESNAQHVSENVSDLGNMAIPMARSDSPSSLPRGQLKRIKSIAAAINQETAEADRLRKDKERVENWKRWGPYLSERQWGTVREDYSPDGSW